MSKKLGQEPAFANAETYNPNNMECNGTYQIGMSKRFYAACAAMQGMLSNSTLNKLLTTQFGEIDASSSNKIICKTAYSIADELLKQESK